VLSAGRADGEEAKEGFGTYSSGAAQVYNHSVPEIAVSMSHRPIEISL